MKIAAIGDIHVKSHPRNQYKDFFSHVSAEVDAIVLCGDLTDTGSPEEAHLLAEDIAASTAPVCGVFGNHDYHLGEAEAIKKILVDAGMIYLEDEPFEHGGASIVGVKGFGGGFGSYMLSSFGEALDKRYVQESVNEALKLENMLHGRERFLVALHYAPVEATVRGESEQIFPFLGSSRLEDVIDRFCPVLVVHGHAHHGVHAGKTARGIPVYNVSKPVLGEAGMQYFLAEI